MPDSKPLRFGMKTLLGVLTGAAILFGAIAVWGGVAVVAAVLIAVGAFIYDRSDARFTAVLTYAVIVALGVAFLEPAFQGSTGHRPGSMCSRNLRMIARALHLYHDRHGCFPPAYVVDKDGTPMHSWRVLILPYLDGNDIYDAYDFDEPWNGRNNSKLAKLGFKMFQCPNDAQAGRTLNSSYVAVVGPETMWPGATTVSIKDVKDGTSNSIAVVEVADSDIHWMEPRDLHLSQMGATVNPKQAPGISSHHSGGAHVAFMDASCRYLPDEMKPQELRELLTIDGGEEIDLTDW